MGLRLSPSQRFPDLTQQERDQAQGDDKHPALKPERGGVQEVGQEGQIGSEQE